MKIQIKFQIGLFRLFMFLSTVKSEKKITQFTQPLQLPIDNN